MGLFDTYENEKQKRLNPRRGMRDHQPACHFNTRLASPRYLSDTRSNKPQCLLKVTSQAKGVRTKVLLNYVARSDAENKLELETESGEMIKGFEEIQSLYDDWSQDFERKKPNKKREPKHTTHIILSAKTGNSSKQAFQVNAAAREYLEQQLGDIGYEYTFVTHQDTEHPHVHVVLKNYNKELGKKFHMNRQETFEMRRQWGLALERHGLEAVATLRRDRPHLLEQVANGLKQIQERESWNDRRMRKAPDMTLTQRKNLSRRITRMKDQVKSATLPFSKDRRAYMKSLRELTNSVRDKSEKDIRKSARATLASVGQQLDSVRTDLVDLANLQVKQKVRRKNSVSKSLSEQKKRVAKNTVKMIRLDVTRAIEHLKQTRLPKSELKEVVQRLREYNDLAKKLNKYIERPHRRGSRAAILNVQAARQKSNGKER